MPGVAAIIVSWNVRDLVRACLTSLTLPPRPDEVVVVDNASADGTADVVAAEFPVARLIRAGANLGFAGGVNAGVAAAAGDYLLLLNPDTELRPGALAAMVRLLERDPGAAIVAPALVGADGTRQSSRRRFPSPLMLAVESTALGRAPLLLRLPARYRLEDTSDAHVQSVDWVYGACFMVRRAALEQIGGMDETYFMYSEEVDLCRRLRQLGWAVLYEPAAEVVHHEGKSSDQVPVATLARFNRSKALYAAKQWGRIWGEAVRLSLLGAIAWEWCVEAAKLLIGHKAELRRGRLAAYRAVLDTRLRRLP
jgi:N-acetylglucosaminyl-diphospho-decaprenol L-rhamnosyltransferase